MERFKRVVIRSILLLMFVPYLGATEPTTKVVVQKTEKPAQGQVEMLEERTPTSKTYLKSDGSKQLVVSQSPIHYAKEENGIKGYFDIDPTFVESKKLGFIGTGEYKNKSNDFDLKVTKNLQSKVFSLEKNGVGIEEYLSNISSTEEGINVGYSNKLSKVDSEQYSNKITYINVAKDTNLTVYSVPDGLKEYITLNNYNGQNVFEFELKLGGTHFEKKEDGSYVFYKDNTNEEVFTIPRFFMWDSKGGQDSEENQYSYDISTDLINSSDRYRFIIKASNEWLSSKDRVFPVIIDPSVTNNAYEDSYVQSGYPWTLSYDQRAIYVGRGDTKGAMRGMLDFPLPDLSRARIYGGRVETFQYANCYGTCTWAGVSAKTVGAYNPWNVYWYNQPGWVWHVGWGQTNSTWAWMGTDVGPAIRHWYNEGNYTGSRWGSIELVQDYEGSWGYRTLVARNHPDYGWWGQPRMIIDYNDYNVNYQNITDVPEMIAGTTVDVPVTIYNSGRNTWFKDGTNPFKLATHWVNSAGEMIIKDGIRNVLPYNVAPGGSFNMIAKVKVPTNSGKYTLKWDMVQDGVTWFSDQGLATHNKPVTVYAPSYASMTHLGTEEYYAKVGPVDITTGGLSYTSTDIAVPSNAKGLGFGRSYNSNSLEKYVNADANGYIREWLVNGPYRENDQTQRLEKAFIQGESTLLPSENSNSNGNLWKSSGYEPNTSQIWYNGIFSGLGNYQLDWANNVTAYSNIYVYSPDTKSAQLRMGSDDGLKAWLNGNLVANRNVARGLVLDSDIFNVTLNQGWNKLLVKVAQGTGGWQMAARFTDSTGKPFNDLKYSLNNPEVAFSKSNMGKGWVTSLEERLFTSDSENIYYKDATGTVNIFTKNSDGTYNKPAGTKNKLVKNTDNTFTIVSENGLKTFFGLDGRLNYRVDPFGNTVNYEYTNGLITKVIDGTRSLTISYNVNNQVMAATNDFEQSVLYDYSPTGQLQKVTDFAGNSYAYTYSSDGSLTSYQNKKGASTVIEYSSGKVVKITDALNNSTQFNYLAKATEVTDALGRKSVATFDGANLLSTFTNAKNYKEKYIYNRNYNITKTFPELDEKDQFYYSYDNIYDLNYNLISEKDPMGNETSYTYSVDGDLLTAKDAKGNISTYTYSTDGRRLLLSEKDPQGAQTKYEYDEKGRVLSVTDSKNQITRYSYSVDGDPVKIISPNGGIVSSEFNQIGQKVRDITELGSVTTFDYDSLGRLTRSTSQSGITNQTEYDVNGNKTKEIDPKGAYKAYDYDTLDRLVKVVDEAGAEVSYKYDAVGNKVEAKDAKGKITKYTYDVLNQLESETDPTGRVSKTTYDRNGNSTTVTDSKGQTTSVTTDKNGNVTKEVTPEGTTNVTYDKTGNIVSASSSTKLVKVYENNFNDGKLDGLTTISGTWGNTNGEVSNANTQVAYVRSQVNNLIWNDGEISFDIKRVSTNTPAYRLVFNYQDENNYYYMAYIFDHWRIGQIVNGVQQYSSVVEGNTANTWYKIKVAKVGDSVKLYVNGAQKLERNLTGLKDGAIQLWHYNFDGRWDNLKVLSASDNLAVAYNANNSPSLIKSTLNGQNLSQFDNKGNVVQSSSETNTVNYEYDASGNVTSVSSTINDLSLNVGTSKITRDLEGKITSIQKANGDKVSYVYGEGSTRVESVSTTNGTGSVIRSYSYSYDLNGNVTSINDGITTKSYEYDSRDQLIEDEAASYQYDISGNRTKMTTSNGDVIYTYDEEGYGNRLLKVEYPNGRIVTYDYDANGNATKKTELESGVSKVTSYEYDSNDYLVKSILPDGSTVEYVYDKVAKRRIQRIETINGVENITKFIYDGDKLVSELDIKGNIIRSYTWDENENLFSISLNHGGQIDTYYYVKNAKGDVVGLTDKDGNLVVEYDYDSWGNIISSKTLGENTPQSLDKENPRLFASYWYDASLGQYFMRARMYDAEIGRFMSQDPLISGDSALAENPYIYCDNNPIDRVDPNGKNWFKAIANGISKAAKWVKDNKAVVAAVVVGVALTVATAGLGSGLGAAIIAGAIIGAGVSATHYTVKNWGKVTVGGFVKAAAGGAISGAVFAPLGFVAGKAVAAVAGKVSNIFTSAMPSWAAKTAGSTSNSLGAQGEAAVSAATGLSKNSKSISTSTGSRIPDFMDTTNKIMHEAKNVNSLSYTRQLRGMVDYAKNYGYKFNIFVNKDINYISGPLLEAEGRGALNIIRIKMR